MAVYDNEPTMMGQGRLPATLVIRQGPQAGMSFPLIGAQMVVGREEGLDVTLQDPEASRRHARITWQAGQYVIEDLGSTNGTFINGVQTTAPQILNPGDSIGIGQTALVFQLEGIQMSAPSYQPPAEYVPSPAPPPAGAATDAGRSRNNMTQYALYGCGCLVLLFICALVVVAAIFLLNPDLVDDLISLSLAQYRPFIA
jgi:hypothetical protein